MHHKALPTTTMWHTIITTRILGFWLYLMSDCVLFAALFATYAVLSTSYAGGPSGHELFNLNTVLLETLCLLTSSFTYGLSLLAVKKNNTQRMIGWLMLTFMLGTVFISMEINEFYRLIIEGNGPQRSAFLSAFFSLVATHGFHVVIGLLWIIIMIGQILKKGLTSNTKIRLVLLGFYWHLLDVVWVFIFTLVYLLGTL